MVSSNLLAAVVSLRLRQMTEHVCLDPAQMRLSMVSSNLLAEPYRGQPPRLPITAYFSVAGWKEAWRRFMSHVKSMFTLAKCQ